MRQGLNHLFVAFNHLIAPTIKFRVRALAFRVAVYIGNRLPHALIKANGCGKLGNGPLQLCVIKQHRVAFVPKQASTAIRPKRRKGVAGDMSQFDVGSQGPADGLINLVPGQVFIPGNLERFAQGMQVSHQPHKPHRKIPAMGQSPQG